MHSCSSMSQVHLLHPWSSLSTATIGHSSTPTKVSFFAIFGSNVLFMIWQNAWRHFPTNNRQVCRECCALFDLLTLSHSNAFSYLPMEFHYFALSILCVCVYLSLLSLFDCRVQFFTSCTISTTTSTTTQAKTLREMRAYPAESTLIWKGMEFWEQIRSNRITTSTIVGFR